MLFSLQPRLYPTATKSSASQGTSGVQKRTPQAHLPPERVFECLDTGSCGKGTVKELELLQDSDDDDSDSEGRRLSIAGLDKLFFIIFVIMYGSCCFYALFVHLKCLVFIISGLPFLINLSKLLALFCNLMCFILFWNWMYLCMGIIIS